MMGGQRTLGTRSLPFVGVLSPLFALVLFLLFLGLHPASALATERWSDIADTQWTAVYGVTADQAASVAAGYEDGTFRPALAVGRGHFAKMAVTGLGLATAAPATPTFSDVSAADPLFPYVEGGAAAGLLSGFEGGSFRPAVPLTRQQACSILGLYLAAAALDRDGRLVGAQGSYPSLETWFAAEGVGVLAAFADAGSVAQVHAPAVAYLAQLGIVRGSARLDGPQAGLLYLEPAAFVTRAQAVALIVRASDVSAASSRAIDPFVSVDWLEEHLGPSGPAVLDLRSASDYAAGHIPGSISVPFSGDSAWAWPASGLTVELPSRDDLFETIGACGLTADSTVVLVGGVSQAGLPLVDTARVATTLIYAGVRNVAILQGGYPAWPGKGLAVTTEVPEIEPVVYEGPARDGIFVSTAEVEQQIGAATIVDTRSAEVYSGSALDPAAPKAGHIPTAKSLPTGLLWRAGGTYASIDVLEQLAIGVLGGDKDQPVIVYCTYGGTASCWWYVLTQVLGYREVRLYDGSAQAWVKDHDMVAGSAGS